MMLNILEHVPIGAYGHNSAEALHALIEAKKLAYADMAEHVAIRRFTTCPSTPMLSKAYAARARARSIRRAPTRSVVARRRCRPRAATPPT